VHSPAANLSKIPSVDSVLNFAATQKLIEQHGRSLVTTAVRNLLGEIRQRARKHPQVEMTTNEESLSTELGKRLAAQTQSNLRPVFNLSGTVLHTNLGRALLPEEAVQAVVTAMVWPMALEIDLHSGDRGDRDSIVERLLCQLTGAEAATVVNNNAAGVFLLLNTLALKKEVIVSRGELIEIGGAFRLPDIMRRAGARLVEVGTTNRTHLKDFSEAITPRTGILMKAHWSNYSITGFTAMVPEKKLGALAHAHGLPFVIDLGSGSLVDLSRFGLPKEPRPDEALANGADLVTFSGDKLLGGPQAGILAGRKDLILRIKKNPLKRALRVGKITLAALEAVLRIYLDPDRLAARLTTLRFLARQQSDIEAQALRLLPHLSSALKGIGTVAVQHMKSQIGSGSLPVDRLPSAGFAIRDSTAGKPRGTFLRKIEAAFRSLPIPVIGFIRDNAFQLDLRCLNHEEEFVRQLGNLRFEP